MKYRTDFAAWMTTLGMNGKEVSAAGALIGVSPRVAQACFRGDRELTKMDRLAMSAVAAKIDEWTPETARTIRQTERLSALLNDIRQEERQCSDF